MIAPSGDFRDAEDAHNERAYSADFPKALRKIKVKQKMYEGDRTHPRLVALDSIKPKLSYPGWTADVAQIEKMHAEEPYVARSDVAFNNKLKALEYSQMMYEATGETSSSTSDETDEEEPEAESTPQTAMTIDGLSSSNSDILGSCTICGDEARSHAFVPCGHLCACGECASKVMRRDPRCPVCRCRALETIEIFL